MKVPELYEYVARHAKSVAYQADTYDDHPTFNSVAAIKKHAERVQGMYQMAMDFNEMRGNESARAAVEFMGQCVDELVKRQAANRKAAKGRPKGYARLPRSKLTQN